MKWIQKYWSAFGGLAGIGILIYMILLWDKRPTIHSLAWIHLSILMFHQFEEYAYPGGFQEFFNRHIYSHTRLTSSRLTRKAILWVNIVIAWTAYAGAAYYFEQVPAFEAGLLLITIFNGLLHTFLGIKLKKYNPGIITGLILFIPFGIYMLYMLSNQLDAGNWRGGIFIFLFGTAMIPASIKLFSVVDTRPD